MLAAFFSLHTVHVSIPYSHIVAQGPERVVSAAQHIKINAFQPLKKGNNLNPYIPPDM